MQRHGPLSPPATKLPGSHLDFRRICEIPGRRKHTVISGRRIPSLSVARKSSTTVSYHDKHCFRRHERTLPGLAAYPSHLFSLSFLSSVCLSVYLSVHPSVRPFFCLSLAFPRYISSLCRLASSLPSSLSLSLPVSLPSCPSPSPYPLPSLSLDSLFSLGLTHALFSLLLPLSSLSHVSPYCLLSLDSLFISSPPPPPSLPPSLPPPDIHL